MKFSALVLAITLTACGNEQDSRPQALLSATLPATVTDTIETVGVTLGNDRCGVTWPKSFPYSPDADGNLHLGETVVTPVNANSWEFSRDREGLKEVVTFTVNPSSVDIRLDYLKAE